MPKPRPIPAPVTRPAPIAQARAGYVAYARYTPQLLRIIDLPLEPGTRGGALVAAVRRANPQTLAPYL